MNTINIDEGFVNAARKQIETVQHNRFYKSRLSNVKDVLVEYLRNIWKGVEILDNIKLLSNHNKMESVTNKNVAIIGTILKVRPLIPTVMDEVYHHSESNPYSIVKLEPYISEDDQLFLEDSAEGKIELCFKDCGVNIHSLLNGCVLGVMGTMSMTTKHNTFDVKRIAYPPTFLPTIKDTTQILKNPVVFISCLYDDNRDLSSVVNLDLSSTSSCGSSSSSSIQQLKIDKLLQQKKQEVVPKKAGGKTPLRFEFSSTPKNTKKPKLQKIKNQTDIRSFFTPPSMLVPVAFVEKVENVQPVQNIEEYKEIILSPRYANLLDYFLKSFELGFDLVLLGGTVPKPFSTNSDSVAQLDCMFKSLLEQRENVRIFLFPGSKDTIQSQAFPITPFPTKLFKESSKFPNFLSITNPAKISFEDVEFLLVDGLFIHEAMAQSCYYQKPVSMAQHLIEVGNICPIGPDTIAIKPGLKNDVFCIKTRPHFLVLSEQNEYEKLTIGTNDTCIVRVPQFASCDEVVVVKENLQVIAVKVNQDGSVQVNDKSEMDNMLADIQFCMSDDDDNC